MNKVLRCLNTQAIVIEPAYEHGQLTSEQEVYLVREAKDTNDPNKLRPEEWRKILLGVRHFKDALSVGFDWGTKLTN